MNRQVRPLDLDALAQFRSTSLLDVPSAELTTAHETALDQIDFDPSQPRRNMVEKSLRDLAASIKVHGVLEPVSLRLNHVQPGRYVVNRGERRVRASRMAGRRSIPAFLDARVDPFAQAVENLHREDMSPFDLCAFIVDREKEGLSRAEIARRLAKSKSHITLVASLQKASQEVRRAFEEGRIRDVRALYELNQAAIKRPEAAQLLLASVDSIARSDVQRILSDVDESARSGPEQAATSGASTARVSCRKAHAKAYLLVQNGPRRGRLDLTCREQMDLGEVTFEDGSVVLIPLGELVPLRWE